MIIHIELKKKKPTNHVNNAFIDYFHCKQLHSTDTVTCANHTFVTTPETVHHTVQNNAIIHLVNCVFHFSTLIKCISCGVCDGVHCQGNEFINKMGNCD